MKKALETTYRDFKIWYDENKEEWCAQIKKREIRHGNIKNVKTAIDRTFIQKFERIPVYVSEGSSWDRKTTYTKGFITSLGLDGVLYVVREGEKTARHFYNIFQFTEANGERIKKIQEAMATIEKAEKEKHAAINVLAGFNADALRKKVLGKEYD